MALTWGDVMRAAAAHGIEDDTPVTDTDGRLLDSVEAYPSVGKFIIFNFRED